MLLRALIMFAAGAGFHRARQWGQTLLAERRAAEFVVNRRRVRVEGEGRV